LVTVKIICYNIPDMYNPRIAVLRGGPSDEHSVSMKTGGSVLRSLNNQNYMTRDIVITKDGEWLEDGRVRSVDQGLECVDLVFLALHGAYGEDGEVQKVLHRKHIPFTGSSSLSSAIAFNKKLTKDTLRNHGVKMPEDYIIYKDRLENLDSIISEIKDAFGPEYIIKPIANGSSVGTKHVREGEALEKIIEESLLDYDVILVEEFIRGREATGGVLEDFRNERIYAFPSVEIIPPRECAFFNKEAKYNGKTQLICPSNFSYTERTAIADTSALVHEALDLTQYSRSDFMVKDGEVYFLEVNTLPGLTPTSIFPKAAEAVGLSFDQLIRHLIETAKV